MAERGSPTLHTIPAHRAFADTLVAGLIKQAGDDPLALVEGETHGTDADAGDYLQKSDEG